MVPVSVLGYSVKLSTMLYYRYIPFQYFHFRYIQVLISYDSGMDYRNLKLLIMKGSRTKMIWSYCHCHIYQDGIFIRTVFVLLKIKNTYIYVLNSNAKKQNHMYTQKVQHKKQANCTQRKESIGCSTNHRPFDHADGGDRHRNNSDIHVCGHKFWYGLPNDPPLSPKPTSHRHYYRTSLETRLSK